MSSFERGAGFRICGAVVRKYVSPTGKCAFLTLATPGHKGGETKHELRCFDSDLVHQVNDLVVGQIVQATGGVDNEPLRNKAKRDIQVDGRSCWVTKLTIRALTVEGSSKAPPTPGASPPAKPKAKGWGDDAPTAVDDDVNF